MFRRLLSSFGFAAAVVAFTTLPAVAQDADFDAKVEEARQKGIDFLMNAQTEDGSWEYEKHEVGITALCTLALVENGISPTDEVVKNGVQYVRDNCRDLTSTYDMALAIVLLSKIGASKDRDKIRALAGGLLAGQLTSGGWTYSCPKGNTAMLSSRRNWPKPKAQPGDNSCTQFAVLGLWVASRDDVEIENAMSGVAKRFVYFQNEDGGWGYKIAAKKPANPDGADPADAAPPAEGVAAADAAAVSKNSMTFAGLFCLTVARATKIRAEKNDRRASRAPAKPPEEEAEIVETPEDFVDEGSEAETLKEDPIFSKGLDRAGQFAKGIGGGASMYFMWSAERLGVMLGLEKIGDVDWFERAASTMIARQAADGSWPGSHGPYSDTAFAILVLRKANLGSDITRLLEGEPKQPFEIVETEARFDTLPEAIAAAEPGQTVRIEGDGPFKMPHLVVDKDLALQAGFGYEPVLEYDVGKDARGLRARPDRDLNYRNMIRTTAGTLTLEGLKLEMDPPFTSQKLDWQAVVADGGNLRILNCTVTESNKRGVTCVQLRQPGTHVVRNSILSGTVTALYVTGAGEQSVSLENSLLFSDLAVDVRQDVKFEGSSKVLLEFDGCTIQAREAMRFLTLATCPVDVKFDNNVVQAEGLAPNLLVKPGDKTARTWSGDANFYDVNNWVGFRGKSETSVRDLATWNRFWGISEEESVNRLVPFSVRRPLASFSHRMQPEDWELTKTSLEAGIYPQTVGTGRGFSRFRSTIQYTRWLKPAPTAVAAK